MKDKFIQWAIVITLLSLFLILVVKVQLGIALLLTTLVAGIIGIAFLMNKYLITFSKQLILITLFFLCCTLGYYKGFQPFFYGFIVCGILGFVIWWFVKDPNRKPSIISLSTTKGMINRVIAKPQPYFAGKGTQIEVGGYILKDPLIYVVDSKTYEDADASLLCLRREIAPPLKEYGKTLPYWPRLSDTTPAQAGTYLNWLAKGRNDPEIELGYVFIYFYGLEKRALVEQGDVIDIGYEVLRLLRIHGSSRSFQQYAIGFFVHLILLGILKPSDKILDVLIKFQKGYLSETFTAMLLDYLAKTNRPLSTRWAYYLSKQDQRTKRSIVLDRASNEFRKLFAIRYDNLPKNKLIPKFGKRTLRIEYHAASPTLLKGSEFGSIVRVAECQEVIGWKRQFSVVTKLFNDCIDELKTYSRKTATYAKDTAIAYESLPPELKDEVEHPKQREWESLLEEFAGDSKTCLIPIEKVALLRGISYRPRLTLGQAKSIAQFVESFGSSIEPEPRYMHKTFQWNDYIAILRLPDEPYLPQGQNYSLVSLIMPLAIEVSLASGALEDGERKVINEFFQERFMLTRNDSLRLEALLDTTLKNSVSLTGIKNNISALFKENQRKSIGKFLVMIAGAVDGVCLDEIKALEKTFKSLVLDKNLVKEFISELGYEIKGKESPRLVVKGKREAKGEAIPPKVVLLDINKIRKIREDSIIASKLLLQAMNQSPSNNSNTKIPSSDNVAVETETNILSSVLISEHVKPFFIEVIGRNKWMPEELNGLAQKHNLTVSAALEEINTWSDECLGDFLIEEGTPAIINIELLKQIGDNQ